MRRLCLWSYLSCLGFVVACGSDENNSRSSTDCRTAEPPCPAGSHANYPQVATMNAYQRIKVVRPETTPVPAVCQAQTVVTSRQRWHGWHSWLGRQ